MQVWATLGNYGQHWGNSWATPGRIYGPTLGLVPVAIGRQKSFENMFAKVVEV